MLCIIRICTVSSFWKDLCAYLGIQILLSTSYHPQTDRQTEILNQVLETAIRAYIGPDLDDWAKMLTPLTLSYNSLVHSTTGYLPAFLIWEFWPITPGSALAGSLSHPSVSHRGINHQNKSIFHSTEKGEGDNVDKKEGDPFTLKFEDLEAQQFANKMEHHRTCAKNAIKISQGWMARGYNCGHIIEEFHKRDLVLINVHGLHLLCNLEGIG